MALGKNLKKKELIATEEVKPKKRAAEKKPKVVKKKQLIKKTKSAKLAPPKKSEPKKDKQAPLAQEEINSGLPMFIAQEIHDRKVQLRKRFDDEIAQLHGKSIQFVAFEIGGELYAIGIDSVREVVPLPNLSKTPNTPKHIKGIANIRGNTYVVFDLATKFHVTGDEIPRYLLVIDGKGTVASLMLSSLPTTFKTNGSNISSEMHMIEDASLDVTYIKGLIQHEDKLVYYLDIIELIKNDKAIIVPNNKKERE